MALKTSFKSKIRAQFGDALASHFVTTNEPTQVLKQRATDFHGAFGNIEAETLLSVCNYTRLGQELKISGVKTAGNAKVRAKKLSDKWKSILNTPETNTGKVFNFNLFYHHYYTETMGTTDEATPDTMEFEAMSTPVSKGNDADAHISSSSKNKRKLAQDTNVEEFPTVDVPATSKKKVVLQDTTQDQQVRPKSRYGRVIKPNQLFIE